MNLIKKCEYIINEININPENDSLISFYGFSLKNIRKELIKISDNSEYYRTKYMSINEIIESCGDNWVDNSSDDGLGIDDIINL